MNTQHIELSKVYKRRHTDYDIFQELMPFKVGQLLLVATYYDSYAMVREGRFFDKIFGEYLQLNILSAPRITSVATREEALEALKQTEFDMVIVMAGIDMVAPVEMAAAMKKEKPDLPILLLVNNNSDLKRFNEGVKCPSIERVFVWNGDTRVFLAMIKYVEDLKNLARDTEVGDVRVILLVEDSERYYSRYLPLLYSIVMTQTQNLMEEDSNDQIQRMMKMRVRPKILLVSSYEEAVAIVDKYLDNLLCVISDVKYMKDNIHDEYAGVELIKYVKSKVSIPCLLQSSDPSNAEKATLVNATFVDKNSDNLSQEISDFIHEKLGFGSFDFLNSRGVKIATATNLREFVKCLEEIPAESLLFHSKRNGISAWLMARGEINLAKRLRPYQIEDFDSSNKLRQTILNTFEQVRIERLRGRVVMFDPSLVNNNRFVMRIGEGSFGGKGRGVAFLSNFIENIDFESIIPDLNISIPATTIIGTAEYTNFIEANDLFSLVLDEVDNEEDIQKAFLNASLSEELQGKLREFVAHMHKPLAVRSSGLFEDSMVQPFAGVYSTYVIPNNHPDAEVRFNQLCTAIKLVYASVFSPSARAYFKAVNYKVEEEKMAVIIQELVGQRSGDRYYPHISGVAQSYNYYPYSHMKPEDGFAVLAVGLGIYVVGGEKAFRFCPRHPRLEMNTISDQIKDSQTHFYSLALDNNDFDLAAGEEATLNRLPIKEAEEDGTLRHCASVYDYQYDRIMNDFSHKGPRVVNFANIIQYDYLPLSGTLDMLLRFFRDALGSPVEIEFAVDMDKGRRGLPTLYLLQIKPLIRVENHADINLEEIDPQKIVLQSNKGMGNGCIDYVKDVIYMDITKFDRTKTDLMAREMEELNKMMVRENKEYILIGPGRWGTRDKFTGIPVLWSQIAKARVIVEMGLPNFPLDASLGSHFFHNVTSMNVGYFSIQHSSSNKEWVNLDILAQQKVVTETHYFKHVEFEKPLRILMNGREQKAVVVFE
ncbi:pyruvate phosphate dikinase-like enzyme [Breznakibacter xylanolyticus]|uniref:Pyruvate phosphate dikinase-like enzyme n=1 Tax=Breznakibacter xylanolyticus TaxID=990 RepID=A0A2W7NF86_9BACT|nr:PEP/pyruvate-binding domain-containing protein [Breznakibacter xylanolyticus]PZX11806.1 pyruvate phosphate dikinase-like enzyme [Breznakibacter xylanolyticus]